MLKNIAPILIGLLLGLAVSSAEAKTRYHVYAIHQIATLNYTHTYDFGDTWDVYDVFTEFRGDCEDFAFSMQKAVGGGQVYLVAHEGTIDHAVYVYAEVVWENNGSIYTVPQYIKNGNAIMVSIGPVHLEDRKLDANAR